MSKIFFTSDLHFNHKNIIEYCQRPFLSLEDMHNTLITNWNCVVSKNDAIFIIGDFAWKNHMHYFHQLNGHKILIIGNHDKMSQKFLRNFTEAHFLLHRVIHEQQVTMCHYAMKTWPGKMWHGWHLYGHTHGRIPEHDDVLSCDVGVDVWNFFPVSFETLKRKMDDRIVNIKARPKCDQTEYELEAQSNVDKLLKLNKVYIK